MSDRAKDKATLEATLAWVQSRMKIGDDPPWVWYRLMQLREACENLLNGMDAVRLVTEDGVELDRNGNIPVQLPT